MEESDTSYGKRRYVLWRKTRHYVQIRIYRVLDGAIEGDKKGEDRKGKGLLLTLPGLGLAEDAKVATYFKVVAVEPDGTLVALSRLGVIDFATLVFVAFLGEAAEEVYAHELAAAELGIGVLGVLGVGTFLQPDNLAIDFSVLFINLDLCVALFCQPAADDALCVGGEGGDGQCHQ